MSGMRQLCASIVGLLALAGVAWAQDSAPKPYHDFGSSPRSYNGPGRDEPDPVDVKEVAIAFFGPPDPTHPAGGQLWQGASLAIEEANREGGYRGLPFRLIPAWAGNPWAGGAATLIRITYTQRIWAIIGGIDGATTHLAEQVVPKALLTLINPAATDRSIHTANVPWMFSCVPGDHLLAPLLSHELKRRGTPFALLSATGHDSRAFVSQLQLAFEHDRLVPILHVEFDPATAKGEEVAGRLASSGAQAAVIIADARDSAAVIKAARATGFAGAILGGPWIARAGPDPALEGVLYPALGGIPAAFRTKFAGRYGREPDYTAAHAYDAANILTAAIRKAGLNRARIRDAVQALSPFQGVTGTIQWDALGQNQRPVLLRAFSSKRDAAAH
jgi:ABC-type branched-subunit amino acid transport system substrate-binding protein